MERGLRPYSNRPDNFPLSIIEGMTRKIEKILKGNQLLAPEEEWLLSHILLVAKFRNSNERERNQILREINAHDDLGHSLGFSKFEIQALNRVVLRKEQEGNLKVFSRAVEERKQKK